MMNHRCVIKIGGSVLKQVNAPEQIRKLLVEFGNAQVNLIIGGGPVIDSLRELDSIHHFSQIEMHWRCVRALRLTYELACEWFPEAQRIETVDSFESHQHCQSPGIYLLATDAFYSPCDGDILPQDWTTTSDSISAMLARKLSIERLVLLKSCDVPNDLSIKQLAVVGIVDGAFEQASQGLSVECRVISYVKVCESLEQLSTIVPRVLFV